MAETSGTPHSPGQGSEEAGPFNRSLPHLDDLYREVVLDHYRRPRGRKKIDSPSISAEGFNPTCGDQVHVAVALEEGRIRDVEVECRGCSISVASGSMMADLLVGKSAEEVSRLTDSFKSMMHGREPDPELDLGDLVALEGVRQFPVRIKCALLAWTTLKEAMELSAKKREESNVREGKEVEEA